MFNGFARTTHYFAQTKAKGKRLFTFEIDISLAADRYIVVVEGKRKTWLEVR